MRKTYYVDPMSGDDTDNGYSPMEALKTIYKMWTTLHRWDGFLLKPTKEWKEPLVIKREQTQ